MARPTLDKSGPCICDVSGQRLCDGGESNERSACSLVAVPLQEENL